MGNPSLASNLREQPASPKIVATADCFGQKGILYARPGNNPR